MVSTLNPILSGHCEPRFIGAWQSRFYGIVRDCFPFDLLRAGADARNDRRGMLRLLREGLVQAKTGSLTFKNEGIYLSRHQCIGGGVI